MKQETTLPPRSSKNTTVISSPTPKGPPPRTTNTRSSKTRNIGGNTETLKVLAFSDIHGNASLLERLHTTAREEDVDLIMICGDFTGPGEEVPEGMIQPFLNMNKRVLLLNGNHESNTTSEFLSEFYSIKNLHGAGHRYKDVGIFGCGGANIGIFQLDDKETFSALEEGHKKINYLKKKIMATHVHPDDSHIERTFGFPGSKGVRRAISRFKPDILICGHVHEAEGMEERIEKTRVINVSKSGKVFEL